MGKLNLKNKKEVKRTLVPISQDESLMQIFKDKTLAELDAVFDCTKIGFDRQEGTGKWADTEFLNLIVETKHKVIQVPFSKEAAKEILADEEYLTNNIEDMVFRLNRKHVEGVDGPDEYTGGLYMNFGKPGGLSLSDNYVVIIDSTPEMVDAK